MEDQIVQKMSQKIKDEIETDLAFEQTPPPVDRNSPINKFEQKNKYTGYVGRGEDSDTIIEEESKQNSMRNGNMI